MAAASTVAGGWVPSPAASADLEATFAHHLGAHVLELVLKLDFLLGDGDAVLGDAGCAETTCRARRCGPWGPSVTLTALARISTPAASCQRGIDGRNLTFFS